MVLRVGLRGEVSLACVAAFHLTYCIVLCESLFRENMNYEFVIILQPTCRKQLVVCPIPVGRILSPSRELMAVDFPLLVRPKKATYEIIM